MKKMILSTVVSILSLLNVQAQEQLEISLKNSSVEWIGEKVTGSHNGTINLSKAFFIFENNALVGGQFEMDMNSIKCTDIESPEYAAKLESHLKDEDFFATEKYPNAKFTITEVIFDGTSYMITGNMIIRGISQEITFPAQFHSHGKLFHADASLKIDRTKHDVKYGSGSFFDGLGDRMIYDEFTLKIHLEAGK